jgi:hypothetical protein
MKHPGHTYGGFIPAISEWGMTEFWPLDALGFLMGFHICNPPVGCRTRELVRG